MHVRSRDNWKQCFFFFLFFHLNRNYSFLFCYIYIESFRNEDFVVLMVFDCFEIRSLVLKIHPSKGVQKNMLTASSFTKNNSLTDTLLIICRKFSEQIFLRRRSDRYVFLMLSFFCCFNGRLMLRQSTDLSFKREDLVKVIPSLLDIFIRILGTVLYPPAERGIFWTQSSI